jgi:2-polyprenyl-6-methoxyphenol hydroxylase-like FAD-dependent oxidoreductase
MPTIQVIIVGAGPVGLTLALDLGQRGVRCLLIERNATAIQLPKNGAVQTRARWRSSVVWGSRKRFARPVYRLKRQWMCSWRSPWESRLWCTCLTRQLPLNGL